MAVASSGLLSVSVVACLLLLFASPASAAAPASVRAPPFVHARPVLFTSTASTPCGAGVATANASADPATGNVSVYACVRANATHPSLNASAEAGFSLRFQVATGGRHTAGVNWTVSYDLARGCYTIALMVFNSTGGKIIGSAGSTIACFGVIQVGHNVPAFEGWNGSLMAHHTYYLETTISCSVVDKAPPFPTTNSVLMTGTLDQVQIQ